MTEREKAFFIYGATMDDPRFESDASRNNIGESVGVSTGLIPSLKDEVTELCIQGMMASLPTDTQEEGN